jgi:hypothetical protein
VRQLAAAFRAISQALSKSGGKPPHSKALRAEGVPATRLARRWKGLSRPTEEAPMSGFLHQTFTDMRSGRDSWRVVAIFSAISFAIAVLVQP